MVYSGVDNSIMPAIQSCNNNRCMDTNKGNLYIFCDDVMAEILCRLPVQCLLRFKCVSKSWCRLINAVCIPRISLSPAARSFPIAGLYFRSYKPPHPTRKYVTRSNGHRLYSHYYGDELPFYFSQEFMSGFYSCLGQEGKDCGSNHSAGKLVEWKECYVNYGLPFMPKPDDFLDCCNGLLLFVNSPSLPYYVCNPATRQCISILTTAHHESQENLEYCWYAALAFDPAESANYKVVRFEHFRTEDLWLDIYSSYTRSWVRHLVKLHAYVTNSMLKRYSVYFNRSLYRFSSCSRLVQFDFEEVSALVQFDLEEVSAHIIELPGEHHTHHGLPGCVGVLNGSLCYATEGSSSILIWSLESSKSSEWILKYNIYIPDLTWKLNLSTGSGPPNSSWVGPLVFHPNRDVIFMSTPGMIVSYDLKFRTLEEIAKIMNSLVIVPGCFFPAFTYVPFLVPFDLLGDIYQNSADYRVEWPRLSEV